jgi:hypothetical protein
VVVAAESDWHSSIHGDVLMAVDKSTWTVRG